MKVRNSVREQVCQLVVASARTALGRQRQDGTLPAGHNGPYGDPETPVRNTAHWSITFLAAWRETGDPAFRAAAARAAAYLDSFAARPRNGAFHCRKNPKKDKTNGLIGQAWAIEALVEASLGLNRPELLETGANVFLLHPYEDQVGGWRRIGLDGRPLGFDRTFNHQIWFAAAGALLVSAGVQRAGPAVRDFVSRLPHHIKLYPSGLIRHVSARFLAGRPWNPVAVAARGLRNASRRQDLYIKAIGYHAFNTYALALVQRSIPDLDLASKRPLAATLEYLLSAEYRQTIAMSPYGFQYNPPGFEAAFTIDTFFPERQETVDRWLQRQLDETYDVRSSRITLNVPDPATAAARLYEVCRLLWPIEASRSLAHSTVDTRVTHG